MIDEEFFKTATEQEQLLIRRAMRSNQKEIEDAFKSSQSQLNLALDVGLQRITAASDVSSIDATLRSDTQALSTKQTEIQSRIEAKTNEQFQALDKANNQFKMVPLQDAIQYDSLYQTTQTYKKPLPGSLPFQSLILARNQLNLGKTENIYEEQTYKILKETAANNLVCLEPLTTGFAQNGTILFKRQMMEPSTYANGTVNGGSMTLVVMFDLENKTDQTQSCSIPAAYSCYDSSYISKYSLDGTRTILAYRYYNSGRSADIGSTKGSASTPRADFTMTFDMLAGEKATIMAFVTPYLVTSPFYIHSFLLYLDLKNTLSLLNMRPL